MSTRLFKDDVLFQQRLLKSAGFYRARLDGIWGPKTDAGYDAFLEESASVAEQLGSFDSRSETHIGALQIPAQRACRRFLTAVHAEAMDVRIISGTRSYEEQNRLFRQGRYGNPGPRITNARPDFFPLQSLQAEVMR